MKENSKIRFLPWLCSAFVLLVGCNPDPAILRRYALYNFEDEGFLTPDLLQTKARISLPGHPGKDTDTLCLYRVRRKAERRALQIFLHIYFDLPAKDAASWDFLTDYPQSFTERDYLRAEVDFRPLLEKGYIALQDRRDQKTCSIVFRIRESNLSLKIRELPLTFRPEIFREKSRQTLIE